MAVDPMSLVQAVRPGPAFDTGVHEPGSLRRARGTPMEDHQGNQRNSDELSASPGDPNYRSKIPPPPCAICSQDHNPNKEAMGGYDHPYKRPGVEEEAHDVMTTANGAVIPVAAMPAVPPVVGQIPSAVASQRVNIMPGRGEDAFIVAIEEAPDWDLVDSWKLTADKLLPMLPILRALKVKIRDNTAGDLKVLEMEAQEKKRSGQ